MAATFFNLMESLQLVHHTTGSNFRRSHLQTNMEAGVSLYLEMPIPPPNYHGSSSGVLIDRHPVSMGLRGFLTLSRLLHRSSPMKCDQYQPKPSLLGGSGGL